MNNKHIAVSDKMLQRLTLLGLTPTFTKINEIYNPRDGSQIGWAGVDVDDPTPSFVEGQSTKAFVTKYLAETNNMNENNVFWRVVKKEQKEGRVSYTLCDEGAEFDLAQPMFVYIHKVEIIRLYGTYDDKSKWLDDVLIDMRTDIDEYAAFQNKEFYSVTLSPIEENPCMAGMIFDTGFHFFNAVGVVDDAIREVIAEVGSWMKYSASNTVGYKANVENNGGRGSMMDEMVFMDEKVAIGVRNMYGIQPVIGNLEITLGANENWYQESFSISLNLLPKFSTVVNNNQGILKVMHTELVRLIGDRDNANPYQMLLEAVLSEDYDEWSTLLLRSFVHALLSTAEGTDDCTIEHVRKPTTTLAELQADKDYIQQAAITSLIDIMGDFTELKSSFKSAKSAKEFVDGFQAGLTDPDDIIYLYDEHRKELNDFIKQIVKTKGCETLTFFTFKELADKFNCDLDDAAIGLYEPFPTGLKTSAQDPYFDIRRAVANIIINTAMERLYDEFA